MKPAVLVVRSEVFGLTGRRVLRAERRSLATPVSQARRTKLVRFALALGGLVLPIANSQIVFPNVYRACDTISHAEAMPEMGQQSS